MNYSLIKNYKEFNLKQHLDKMFLSELFQVKTLRQLERKLFSAWCMWLCYPSRSIQEELKRKQNFVQVASIMDQTLASTSGPFFLDEFSTADVVFVPYVERMNASLFYYKGFVLRDAAVFPHISAWFDGLETRQTYLGIYSLFPLKFLELGYLSLFLPRVMG